MFPLYKKYVSLTGVSEKWKKLTSISQKISFHDQKNKVSLKKFTTPDF